MMVVMVNGDDDPFKQRQLMQLGEAFFKKPCFVSTSENSTYHEAHMTD